MNTKSLSLRCLKMALLPLFPALAFSTQAQSNSLPLKTTFNNPSPAFGDYFGGSVAALGSDRVLIGAEGAKEVYLLNVNGTVLKTFPNPDTAAGGFGAALTAVGNDRVLIGAYNYSAGVPLAQLGRAFLFATNGTLVTTFINPAPTTLQAFGWSVAALGSDRVLISGLSDVNKPGPYAGGVYLFGNNGTLLKTFTTPMPSIRDDGFGVSVSTVGTDRVLIGAYSAYAGAGAAYLFSTNGTLLTTFTNPVPALGNSMGFSLSAVGSDRVIVGSINGGVGGAAYLFSTNGTLLTAFTNSPPNNNYFGYSVSAVGTDRVLVGASQDGSGAFQAGAAYLFSTNGTLLNTITNPAPASYDSFGISLAAVGTNGVIIAATGDDAGATDAGSAYLFSIPDPVPPLSIQRNGSGISVSWITAETGLILQQIGSLSTSNVWSNATNSISVTGLTNFVQQSLVRTNRFFRLARP